MVDYDKRLEMLEEAEKENREEHKEIMKRLNDKDISDAVMREQLDTLVKTTNRIEGKIDEQSKAPAKKWELVVSTIITTLVSGGVGALIGFLVSNK